MTNAEELNNVLEQFVFYECSKELKEFSKALEQFKEDIPNISNNLRDGYDL